MQQVLSRQVPALAQSITETKGTSHSNNICLVRTPSNTGALEPLLFWRGGEHAIKFANNLL